MPVFITLKNRKLKSSARSEPELSVTIYDGERENFLLQTGQEMNGSIKFY